MSETIAICLCVDYNVQCPSHMPLYSAMSFDKHFHWCGHLKMLVTFGEESLMHFAMKFTNMLLGIFKMITFVDGALLTLAECYFLWCGPGFTCAYCVK